MVVLWNRSFSYHCQALLTIHDSKPPVCADTYSQPYVPGFLQALRGEFSNRARVTTFVYLVCRYQINVQHISGIANLPSGYSSRNPLERNDQTWQICTFVNALQESVDSSTSVQEVLQGSMAFTNRAAWMNMQQSRLEMPCSPFPGYFQEILLKYLRSNVTQG